MSLLQLSWRLDSTGWYTSVHKPTCSRKGLNMLYRACFRARTTDLHWPKTPLGFLLQHVVLFSLTCIVLSSTIHIYSFHSGGCAHWIQTSFSGLIWPHKSAGTNLSWLIELLGLMPDKEQMSLTPRRPLAVIIPHVGYHGICATNAALPQRSVR